jgi:tRNA modification GTPase
MRGGFKKILSNLREELIKFSALMELELDFAEEDVEFADRSKFVTLVNTIHNTATSLVQSFSLGNVIKNGVSVAIIGEPNAGKSTLLNALLNDERAIVSDIAGTTRDTIEESLQINGVLFRLIDTAGIRHNSTDVIENLGIERSKQNANDADIIILLHDATKQYHVPNWIQKFLTKTMHVVNKIDLSNTLIKESDFNQTNQPVIYISAKQKTDLQNLTTILYQQAIGDQLQKEDTIITNTRHLESLQKIVASTNQIKIALTTNSTTDLLTSDIRYCLNCIAEITGELSNENVLDYIFSKFCIGK